MSTQNLKKRIGFLTGIGLTVSMVVGSGLFALPGTVIAITNPKDAVLGWLLAAIAVMPLIQIFSTLGTRYPVAEGVAKYTEILCGEGGVCSMSMVACGTLAIGMPVFFLVIGNYIAELLQLPSPLYQTIFAILAIILSTLANLLGPERYGLFNKLIVPTIVVFICGLSMYYFYHFHAVNHNLTNQLLYQPLSITNLWAGAAIAFWAFQGWENISFGLEEFENPQQISKIYWISFAIILIIYLPFIWSMSLAASSGLDVNGISGLTNLLGTGIVKIALLVIIIAILLANSITWTFGASRIAYASACKKLLPRSLAKLSKNNLPQQSLLICSFYYIVMVLMIYFFHIPTAKLFLFTTQGFILLYAISVLAYIKISYSLLQKITGIFGLISCSLLLLGFSWMLIYPITLAVYGYFKYRINVLFGTATSAQN